MQQQSKLLSNGYPCVKLWLWCKYIGETEKSVLTRSTEYQEDSMTRKWKTSSTTEHSKDCHRRLNWLHPKTLAK